MLAKQSGAIHVLITIALLASTIMVALVVIVMLDQAQLSRISAQASRDIQKARQEITLTSDQATNNSVGKHNNPASIQINTTEDNGIKLTTKQLNELISSNPSPSVDSPIVEPPTIEILDNAKAESDMQKPLLSSTTK